ncbi:MAG: CIA30 family protein [Flavobacteriaceae bacterium]|nr:CIA30 family protein [Flavobacteriaceae bacterium]
MSTEMVIYDFNDSSNPRDWRVVDDVVMGGVSSGNFDLTEDGHGLFYGKVSTDNYGGFSSIRHRASIKDVDTYSHLVLRVKGDGKKYQIRVKASRFHYHSYIQYFKTTTSWQTIRIPLKDMYPTFRGRELNMENFAASTIKEIAFLIGNKRNENFQLLIDKIYLD